MSTTECRAVVGESEQGTEGGNEHMQKWKLNTEDLTNV